MYLFHFEVRRRSFRSSFIVGIFALMLSFGCTNNHQTPEEKTYGDINGSLKTGLGMFEVDCDRYPTTEEGLQALLKKPAGISEKKWKGPYFEKASKLKDGWGHEYIYRCPGIHNTEGYDLYSIGPDGKDNTGDEIGNWVVPAPIAKK